MLERVAMFLLELVELQNTAKFQPYAILTIATPIQEVCGTQKKSVNVEL